MESKYNLLTRLLKNIKNVITPEGGVAGSGGGVLVVHEVEQRGKVFLEGTLPNVDGYAWRTETEDGKNVYYIDINADLSDVDLATLQVNIGDNSINNVGMTRLTYADGTLHIKAGWSGQSYGYDIIGKESDAEGQPIVAYTTKTTLDKTYKEIADAGFAVLHLVRNATEVYYLTFLSNGWVSFEIRNYIRNYATKTENDYPALVVQDGILE